MKERRLHYFFATAGLAAAAAADGAGDAAAVTAALVGVLTVDTCTSIFAAGVGDSTSSAPDAPAAAANLAGLKLRTLA